MASKSAEAPPPQADVSLSRKPRWFERTLFAVCMLLASSAAMAIDVVLTVEETHKDELATSFVGIVVANESGSVESDVTVELTLPTGFSGIPEISALGPLDTVASCNSGGASTTCSAGELLSWDVGDIGPGAVVRLGFPAQLAGTVSDGDTLVMTADVIQSASTVASDSQTLVADFDQTFHLRVDEDQDPVASGAQLTYTLRYGNGSGSSASSTTLSFDVPAGTTFVSATGGGVESGGTVTWSLGTLPAGQIGSQQVVVTVGALSEGELVEAQATLDGTRSALPVTQSSNTVSYIDSAVLPDVAVSLGPNPMPAAASRRDVEIVVSNQTGSTIFGAAMEMRWPAGFGSLSESLITGPFDAASSCSEEGASTSCEGNERLFWTLGNLAPGQSVRTTMPVAIASGLPDGFTMSVAPLVTVDGVSKEERASYTVETPVLSLALDEDGDPVPTSETLTYTLRYGNISGSSVASAELVFPIPDGTSFDSASGNGVFSSGEVSWSLGTLAAGQVATQTVQVTVDGGLSEGTLIEAAAVVAGTQSLLPVVREASTVTRVAEDAPVALALSLGPNPAPASSSRRDVEIVVSNPSGSTVFGVTMEMRYPVGLSSLTETLITGPFDAAGSCSGTGASASCEDREVLRWDFGNLAAGQTVRTTLPVITDGGLADGFTMTLEPVVTVGGELVEERKSYITETPALNLTVDEDQDPVAPGATLGYTLRYANISAESVTSAELQFPVPDGTTFVSASSGGSLSGGVVTWSLGTLAAGEIGKRTVEVSVNASSNGTLIEAPAAIDGVQSLIGVFREASTVTAVRSSVPLQVALSLGPNPTPANANRRDVEILVSNPTASTVFGATMLMRFPAGLSSLGESFITGPFDAAGSCFETGASASCEGRELLRWDLGNLAAGQTVRTTLPVAASSSLDTGFALAMAPLVTADSVEIEERLTYVVDAPTLTLAVDEAEYPTLQLAQNPVEPGDSLTYVIRYGNLSGSAVSGTELAFPVPQGTTLVSATGGPSLSDGVLTWSLGTLSAAEVGEQKVRVLVPGGTTNGTLIQSAAEIYGTEGADDVVREAWSAAMVHDAAPLALEVAALSMPVAPGGSVDTTLNVTNNTGGQLFGVELTMRYPVGFNSVLESAIDGIDTLTSCNDAGASTSCSSLELVRWPLGILESGETVSLDFTTTATTLEAFLITVDAEVEDDSGGLAIATVSLPVATQADDDGDGIGNGLDNCLVTSNVNQLNNDLDALGDNCDPDDDNDGMTDVYENTYPSCLNSFIDDADGDCDGDGLQNGDEFVAGTDPTDEDTDGDNITDARDHQPTDGTSGRARLDLSPDGDSDMIFRDGGNGRWYAFVMENFSATEGAELSVFRNLDWEYQTAADFDDDGDADILVRSQSTGGWRIFTVENDEVQLPAITLGGVFSSADWEFQAAADFDGDRDADIVVRNSVTGAWRIFTIENNAVTAVANLALFRNPIWEVQAAEDGDGDGDADILLRASSTGAWRIFEMEDNDRVSVQNLAGVFKNTVWSFQGMADFDADGDSDMLIRATTTDAWRVFEIDNFAAVGGPQQPGLLQNSIWELQCIGDYDFDGDQDILLRASSNGVWRVSEVETRNQVGLTNPGIAAGETRTLLCN